MGKELFMYKIDSFSNKLQSARKKLANITKIIGIGKCIKYIDIYNNDIE